jgi:hypothetical protein
VAAHGIGQFHPNEFQALFSQVAPLAPKLLTHLADTASKYKSLYDINAEITHSCGAYDQWMQQRLQYTQKQEFAYGNTTGHGYPAPSGQSYQATFPGGQANSGYHGVAPQTYVNAPTNSPSFGNATTSYANAPTNSAAFGTASTAYANAPPVNSPMAFVNNAPANPSPAPYGNIANIPYGDSPSASPALYGNTSNAAPAVYGNIQQTPPTIGHPAAFYGNLGTAPGSFGNFPINSHNPAASAQNPHGMTPSPDNLGYAPNGPIQTKPVEKAQEAPLIEF